MGIDLVPETPRNDGALVLSCGVLLYRHIDLFQKMEVMEMLYDRSIIASVDGAELYDLIVAALVQSRWHLWSLSTEKLASILKFQQNAVDLLAYIGIGISALSAGDFMKELMDKKKLGKAGVIFAFSLIAHHAVVEQDKNSKDEMNKHTPEPLSS